MPAKKTKKTPRNTQEFIYYRITELEESTTQQFEDLKDQVKGINAVAPQEFADFKTYVQNELSNKVDKATFMPYQVAMGTIATVFLTATIVAITRLVFK